MWRSTHRAVKSANDLRSPVQPVARDPSRDVDAVPHRAQALDDGIVEPRFKSDRGAGCLRVARFARRVLLHVDAEARALDRELRLDAVVDHRDEQLDVALRLHEAPHVREGRPQISLAKCEGRDDGVVSTARARARQ